MSRTFILFHTTSGAAAVIAMRSLEGDPAFELASNPRCADLESGCRSCHDTREDEPGFPLRRALTFNFTLRFNWSLIGEYRDA
jgi:hypothetical protein